MKAWAQRLSTLGQVLPFDYPYQAAGKKRPDPMPKLLAAHRQTLVQAREKAQGSVFLAGKSMGSRMGCHLSLEEPVQGLICFGYPLKAAASGALRDQVLLQLQTPILFLQGTRDALCPLDSFNPVLSKMTAPYELHVVEGGDHSLTVLKRQSQEEADQGILEVLRRFVSRVSGGELRPGGKLS
jgi:predicted alpha/beta-hydrolase family hydrolase